MSTLFDYLIRHADDRLILSHRLSELSGHGPILEEDIATTNIALDLLGVATSLYEYAAEILANGTTADALAYKRQEREFRNLLLVEQDNGDFAKTMCRQFFFDTYDLLFWDKLCSSTDERINALAHKSVKETKYHYRHSSEWILRFGDGTEESNQRLKDAIDELWLFTGEMFINFESDSTLIDSNITFDLQTIKEQWVELVNTQLIKATLNACNPNSYMQLGGREGKHTEFLGHILSEMQYLTKAYPGAEW